MGNQALNPCITAVEDETDAKNRSKPKLINRLLHLTTSNSSADNKQDISRMVIKEVQESVMDYIKDQIGPNANGQNIAGFAAGNMLMKLSHYLRPADGGAAPKQLFNFGERGSGFRARSTESIQDFHQLKQKCLRNGQLFEDVAFPPRRSSVYFSASAPSHSFEWRRPHELVSNPQFIEKDASRFDVKQGELGDCWLLAAIANLTLHPQLFQRVVPPDQRFDQEYAGIFHFRFWQYGKWIDVVVDDRLPTVNGKLIFMHSEVKNEFWSALLEKAYAKLHGSYEALKGGTFGEAMEDFTGGVAEFFELQSKECPDNLFSTLRKDFSRGAFLGCSVQALSAEQSEAKLPNGLIIGHAYSITQVDEVEIQTPNKKGKIPLLRVRNPWGNEAEWKGPFSDSSREWTLVSNDEKARLGLDFRSDGEFWMSFKDFKENFTNLEVCNLGPQSSFDEDTNCDTGSICGNKHWEESIFDGAWISGVTAGGCRNHLQTYPMNPQYLITLVDHDEDDDKNFCTLIIALMQKNRRSQRRMGLDTLTIGFAIYAIHDNMVDTNQDFLMERGFVRRQLLDAEFFKYNKSVARSPSYINLREVILRTKLPPGKYCIIPSTFDPNEEGEFILRIFTEKPPKDCIENDDEVGIISQPVNPITPDGPDSIDSLDQSTKDLTLSHDGICDTCDCFGLFGPSSSPTAPSSPSQSNTNKGKQGEHRSAPASVQNMFVKIAGEDMEVDGRELQELLNFALKKEYKFDGFSMESCRSMVAMMDEDKSGKLGIDEFVTLWRQVKHWCEVFKKFDRDSNHMMNASELRDALQEANLSANRHTLQVLILRYGHISSGKKGDVKIERALTFDAFILCCIKLKHCIDLWCKQMSSQSAANSPSDDQPLRLPQFSLDQFVENVMYC